MKVPAERLRSVLGLPKFRIREECIRWRLSIWHWRRRQAARERGTEHDIATVVLCVAALVTDGGRGLSLRAVPNSGSGKDLFERRCSGCHAPDLDKAGPRVRGVLNRKAGSVAGHPYSDALRNWGQAETQRRTSSARSPRLLFGSRSRSGVEGYPLRTALEQAIGTSWESELWSGWRPGRAPTPASASAPGIPA